MLWLKGIDGPIDEFNQSVLVQAPEGVAEDDVVTLLQSLLDRHAMLRLRVSGDGVGGGLLRCRNRVQSMPPHVCTRRSIF